MWYQNIDSTFFRFVRKHVCDGQNYDPQDRASIPVKCTVNKPFLYWSIIITEINTTFCHRIYWLPTHSSLKKVTKGLYFTHLARSPRWTVFNQNLHGVWCLRRNHVCQVSCLNSHGLRFYRMSNFPFLYCFFAWALQQCSAMALPVISRLCVV